MKPGRGPGPFLEKSPARGDHASKAFFGEARGPEINREERIARAAVGTFFDKKADGLF
jgi:hypothetical protein